MIFIEVISFEDWFRHATGHKFPFKTPSPMQHIGGTLWADRPSRDLTSPLAITSGTRGQPLLLAGHWGYSAIYFVWRSHHHNLFFRLPYGGSYGDRRIDGENALEFLTNFRTFHGKWKTRLIHYEVSCNMGDINALFKSSAGRTLRVSGAKILADNVLLPPGAFPRTSPGSMAQIWPMADWILSGTHPIVPDQSL